jgi:2C-methyl-D-erythritol 2,4-cyclodiphosphate synthase
MQHVIANILNITENSISIKATGIGKFALMSSPEDPSVAYFGM